MENSSGRTLVLVSGIIGIVVGALEIVLSLAAVAALYFLFYDPNSNNILQELISPDVVDQHLWIAVAGVVLGLASTLAGIIAVCFANKPRRASLVIGFSILPLAIVVIPIGIVAILVLPDFKAILAVLLDLIILSPLFVAPTLSIIGARKSQVLFRAQSEKHALEHDKWLPLANNL